MEGGVTVTGGNVDYKGRITLFVIVTCLVAAMGGLIFGYDIGISGGVTSMESFLKEFFPSVYINMNDYRGPKNTYCTFDSELLQLFTSSLYIAALVASIFASMVTRVLGRKVSMLCGGLVFLTGAILNGAAVNIEMLIMGRLLLGVGVGFANQSVPLYLSEMAPARIRGALNIGFQLAICIGILGANLVNYGTNKIAGGWGWRVSLGLAAVPAIIMSVGSLLLPDTPNSLIERGHSDKARKMLVRIRGTDMVDDEYQDLVNASDAAKLVKHPWRNIFERKYRPHLVMSIMIPMFQQFTGINVIMFYAPVLFKSLGFGDDAALMSAVITGVANVFCTLISCFIVDRVGRRMLFIEGGIQMLICQVVVGVLIGLAYGTSGEGDMSKMTANLVLLLVCLFVAAFAWSWGPLGWLVPSEIFPMEIRSAGQAINVSVNMLFTFIIAQAFLTMLCHLKFALFFFFAVWEGIMTLFIYLFLPETKGVPIEEMNRVWKEHWFWGKYIPDNAVGVELSDRLCEA